MKKEFKCANGKVYMVPENHCLFCEHCTDILYDYTHGPYACFCELNYENAGDGPCKHFSEEKDCT